MDNVCSGGLSAVVDAETGIVCSPGFDKLGYKCILHPDSGEQIVGFHIPRWDEAMALVKELAMKTEDRYTGWDIALSKNGWVMVEGNDCGQFIQQRMDKTGRLGELLELMER